MSGRSNASWWSVLPCRGVATSRTVRLCRSHTGYTSPLLPPFCPAVEVVDDFSGRHFVLDDLEALERLDLLGLGVHTRRAAVTLHISISVTFDVEYVRESITTATERADCFHFITSIEQTRFELVIA